MNETERWVNEACERILTSGHVRLYRDLYKDLREQLPCGEVCRLIAGGLCRTRMVYLPDGGVVIMHSLGDRARAIAALRRLGRYAIHCEAKADGLSTEEAMDRLACLYRR